MMNIGWKDDNTYSRFVKIYSQGDFEVIIDKVAGVNDLRYLSGSFSGSGTIPPGEGDLQWGSTSSSGEFWAITPLLNRDGTPLSLTRDALDRLRNGELPRSSI